MIDKKKHAAYVKEILEHHDLLYRLTEPSRILTVYWAVNTLRMLKDPKFEEMKPTILNFVKSCLNADGGFGGTSGYPSTILTTFHALQVLYIYDSPFYSPKTAKYITGKQEGGLFINDEFGEKDTRFDCCAILGLKLLNLMHKQIENNWKSYNSTSRVVYHKNGIRIESAVGSTDGPPWSSRENTSFFFEDSPLCMNRNELAKPVEIEFLNEIGFDIDGFLFHLLSCYNRDGGFGQRVGSETHAAHIFCVLSSLRAIGALDSVDTSKIEEFLVYRQTLSGGFCGRIKKKEDVCYSFWALASLIMIDSDLLNIQPLKQYISRCEGHEGGFSDRPGNECDLYHQMFSIASLSLLNESDLDMIDPGLGI